ncbi:SH3 domain-containing protein [Desulfovibrio aerotolerans]|uniref:SH3 domain-containing protein n=1 Tax=Solidesulfovibrio aerotolerans TaxID=295255 RepID=A0A7C9IMM9_9BACT|nr:SH3 domain-containing protein [Solidesulfovibrio aerotolerans]MYL84104.1 SH3 domain-containing protein [Solidesulfovibrio aerotolerans]
MNRTLALVLGLAVCLGVLALPQPGQAQPCPPGMIWTPGGCRPAAPPPGYYPPPRYMPPPRYVPPPRYMPPPVYAPAPVYDPAIKQVARRSITLRSCPGEACPPTTALSRGTPVQILAWDGPFVLVHVPGSRLEGWTKRNRLTR